jgi:hypothetical protein
VALAFSIYSTACCVPKATLRNLKHQRQSSCFGNIYALSYTTYALVDELLTAGTLRNSFGADYEVGFPMNGAIQKLDDVTYMFWFVRRYDKGQIILQRPY